VPDVSNKERYHFLENFMFTERKKQEEGESYTFYIFCGTPQSNNYPLGKETPVPNVLGIFSYDFYMIDMVASVIRKNKKLL
jgi:hypothetical protein